MIVIITVFIEEFLLCASGKISDTPMQSKNPAKKPKYISKEFSDNVKNRVDIPPNTGAMASKKRKLRACLFVFLCLIIIDTVFKPSEKS